MKNLWTSWQWHPWTIGLIGLIFLLYLRSGVFRSLKQLAPFLVAMLLLGLCLLSPLQLLSAQYLFSIHMAVHVVLLLIIAPLLVLALPGAIAKAVGRCCHCASCLSVAGLVYRSWHYVVLAHSRNIQ